MKVVHCKRQDYDVYIGRPSIFGNPFSVMEYGRKGAIEKYRQYFHQRILEDQGFKEEVLKLKGKILGCFCAPRPCHGDIIIEYLKKENQNGE